MTDETNRGDIAILLASINSDLLGWDWDNDESGPDLESNYAERISLLGHTRVLRSVFSTHPGSRGTSLLLHLCFVWKGMHYRDWLRVLAERPEIGKMEVGYFRNFFCGYLAISFEDAVKEAELSGSTMARLLPEGRPASEEPLWGHVEDVFANLGLDPWVLWRRLSGEGAPMLVSPEQLLQRGRS
ncbi:hypothetical protein [Enhygromyxa salina]|uniref:hypothetical protein n=1 Tax=Enhygromyxa salina TaxID=215803 RepID=UPI000696911B|nr:hypothetical protein [Enhygromyxa salina]